jgi:hypothetical protein
MGSSYAVGHFGALLSRAHGPHVETKAPAIPWPQVVLVVAAVLPLREFDTTWALDILASRQRRNHAASLSHRKRRMGLYTQRE